MLHCKIIARIEIYEKLLNECGCSTSKTIELCSKLTNQTKYFKSSVQNTWRERDEEEEGEKKTQPSWMKFACRFRKNLYLFIGMISKSGVLKTHRCEY